MSTLRVSNIEAKADPSSPSVDEKLKVTNSNGDVLIHIDGKTAGITTVGINTTDKSFTVDAAQNVEFSGIVTATKFSLSGGGEITGGDGNFTGILTANSVSATDSTIGVATVTTLNAVSANFTGNVSIAGTLTYEDVTNVDSIGIATARTGIDVTGGHIDIIDNSKIRVGTGDDLQIYHDSGNNYVAATSGSLFIRGSDLVLEDASGNDYIACSDGGTGGTVALKHLGSTKLETTTTGAKVTGALEVTQEYPSIRTTLDLNFAATKTLDRRITFTRDGVGTYVDDMGIVRYASNNVPRFDHNVITGESLGLLIEESRSNSLTYSQPTSAASFGSSATKTFNAATAPNGKTEAFRITHNGSSGNSNWRATRSITFSANSMVLSIWAKGGGGGNNYFTWSFQNLGGAIVRAGFKLEGDGETSIITNGNGGHTLKIEKYPDSWYRCIIIGNTQSSGTTTQFLYTVSAYNESSSVSGGSVLLWGFQLEEGAFATSYIPTSESTVTRGADIAKITGTNFTDFYNQTEGTVFSSHQQYSGQGDTQNTYVYQIANANSSSVAFRLLDKNNYYGSPTKLTATQWTNDVALQKPDATNGERIRTAFACKVNDAAVSYDGATVLTDTSLDMNSGQIEMSIGGFTQTPQAFLNGHIQQISYYPKRLPNAQLQGLTQQ